MQKSNIMTLLWLVVLLTFVTAGCDSSNATPPEGDQDRQDEAIERLPVPEGDAVLIAIDTDAAIATVSDKFLSFALDTSQIVGGHWWSDDDTGGAVGSFLTDPFDFTRPRLKLLAEALAPAYLRIGGSEADKVAYDLSDDPPDEAPSPFEFVFTKAQWDGINTFAADVGLEVFFTLNAGPGCRLEDKSWKTACARDWMAYTHEQGYPVTVWELGNEINGYTLMHGVDWSVSGEQYKADIEAFKALRDELDPNTPIAGPSCAFWPDWGEMGPIYPDFMEAGGGALLDIITWHYYPQQSDRCPVASRLAGPDIMLDPLNLDEIATWAGDVEALRDEHAPGVPVWLGESGNAQCGGQIGLSDRFVSGFWWLDELGQMARRSQPVVVRQTLSGSDYGLIDDEALEPNPDYWLSLLWKTTMGERVLDAQADASKLRVYAHCLSEAFKDGVGGGVGVLILNLDKTNPAIVTLPDLPTDFEAFEVTAPDLLGTVVELNGQALAIADDETLPNLEAVSLYREGTAWFAVQPTSMVFLIFTDAEAGACR